MLGGITGSFKAGRRSFEGGGSWDPGLDLTPELWIDASDASSYTLKPDGSGGFTNDLDSLTDKTGNNILGFSGDPQRAHNAVGLGKPAFYANGSESIQTEDGNSNPVNATVTDGFGNHWAIGVVRFDGVNASKDSFWSFEGTGRTYAYSAGATNNTFPGEIDYDGNNSISSGNAKNEFNLNLSRYTFAIVSIIFNKAGDQIFGRINGTTRTSVDEYDNNIASIAQARLFRNRGNIRIQGYIAEYFYVADVPGTGGTDISDVEKAEGYLAHKWNLTGVLPSVHPYKNSAP